MLKKFNRLSMGNESMKVGNQVFARMDPNEYQYFLNCTAQKESYEHLGQPVVPPQPMQQSSFHRDDDVSISIVEES